PDNEAKAQAAFNKLAKGRTVIMIAHRLSTVTNADRIFVLKDGKLAESGKFDELSSSGGLFSSMWNEYRQSVQWKVAKEV
ncbi:MAG: ABC transporter ATP-binding protein, partial [Ruminococcus bromii]|nr:ABC transporter ATP-binding protein [Ruminococcus bromii]